MLSNKAKLSLYKKSINSGIGLDTLEEVYNRGIRTWSEKFGGTPEKFAFDRVNSFISEGFASKLDADLHKKVKKDTPSSEPQTKDKKEPLARLVGTNSLLDILKKDTPGQCHETTISIIRRVLKNN